MKIGIVIPTYQRKNGSTKNLLTRALESIKNQTHQDYMVFLIGDKYEDSDEFFELSTSIIPNEKIIYQNLERAFEREKYMGIDTTALWSAGGITASNIGLAIAKNYVDYCCHLDDDDYFLENHLSSINEVIETKKDAVFIHTLSTYRDIHAFPVIGEDDDIIEREPIPAQLIRSSSCLNIKKIDLRYRDVFAEVGVVWPSDADMWERLAAHCKEKDLKTYCYRRLTCVHDSESTVFQ